MWELGYKESWALKNWCFWTVVLEKTLESPLDCKEIQPVHPEGDKSWVFIGRTDVEAETPIPWPPHAKSWLIGKDLMLGAIGSRGEGDDRGWDGWMASPTRWTWVWVNSEFWWWTGRPSVLWFMGLQRVGHDWATELNGSNIILFLVHQRQAIANSKIAWAVLHYSPSAYSLHQAPVSPYLLNSILVNFFLPGHLSP